MAGVEITMSNRLSREFLLAITCWICAVMTLGILHVILPRSPEQLILILAAFVMILIAVGRFEVYLTNHEERWELKHHLWMFGFTLITFGAICVILSLGCSRFPLQPDCDKKQVSTSLAYGLFGVGINVIYLFRRLRLGV